MKKLAAIANGNKITYLYEGDLDTKDKILSLLKDIDSRKAVLFHAGETFIEKTYEYDELYDMIESFASEEDDIDDLYFDLINDVTSTQKKLFAYDKERIYNSLTGKLEKGYTNDCLVLLGDGKLDFDEYVFKDILEKALLNIDIIKNREDDWLGLIRKLPLFTSFEYRIYLKEYNLVDIWALFLNEEDIDIEELINNAYKALNEFIEDKDKPNWQKRMPIKIKERIIETLFNLEEPNDIDKENFIHIVSELSDMNNINGLHYKCYSYYGGNSYVKEDYKISEECLLKLIDLDYRDNYADTLGYIYYYGRVNNGIPQYDKAYEYFTLASASGNVEARYKLGDMYKNGFYVKKNLSVAKTIYESLYNQALYEFHQNPKYSSLADVALRIAGFYDNEEDYLICYQLYLQALVAIKKRQDKFDSSVERKIIKSIKEVYAKYKDKINNLGFNEGLGRFSNYTIDFDKNRITLSSSEEEFFYDYKHIYAGFKDVVQIKIKGNLLSKIKEKEEVDHIERDGNIYTFYTDYNEVVARIEILDYEFIHKDNLISNEDDDKEYHVAICQYSKGEGKKYHFFYEGDSDLDSDWIIEETNQDIYPLEFVNLKGYELPCDIKYIKHIKIK